MGHVASWGLYATWTLFAMLVTWRLYAEFRRRPYLRGKWLIGLTVCNLMIIAVIFLTAPLDTPLATLHTRTLLEISVSLVMWYPALGSALLYWISLPTPNAVETPVDEAMAVAYNAK